jgi:thiol-disulfide isomerase/thioredoxin
MSTSCHVCKESRPIFHKIEKEFPTIEFHYVDINPHQHDIVRYLHISKYPTVIGYIKGKQKFHHIGGLDKNLLVHLHQLSLLQQ